jgi:hypothetical protein
MRILKLRIAWSVACGLACVLLIVLWVRSYWQLDEVQVPLSSSSQFTMQSFAGSIWMFTEGKIRSSIGWRLRHKSVDDLLEITGMEIMPPRAIFGMGPGNLQVPYWFLAPAFATSAAFPWLRWRFSLGTLLIATTLVAVVLGLVVWLTSR